MFTKFKSFYKNKKLNKSVALTLTGFFIGNQYFEQQKKIVK